MKNILKTWLAFKHGPKLIKHILKPFAAVALVILAVEGLKHLPDDEQTPPMVRLLKNLLN